MWGDRGPSACGPLASFHNTWGWNEVVPLVTKYNIMAFVYMVKYIFLIHFRGKTYCCSITCCSSEQDWAFGSTFTTIPKSKRVRPHQWITYIAGDEVSHHQMRTGKIGLLIFRPHYPLPVSHRYAGNLDLCPDPCPDWVLSWILSLQ